MKIAVYVSCALSICAIILSLSNVGYNTSMASILVAVLGSLVTFLVAWQIYNVYVSKEEMNKLRHEYYQFKNEVSNAIVESNKQLVQSLKDGLLLLRDLTYRNIEAVETCILLRQNQGVGAALDFVLDNLDKTKDDGGLLRRILYETAEGCISDIVSKFMFNGEDFLLRECVDIIPHDKFCRLYSIDFTKDGWDVDRITQFKMWLDIIAARYPAPFSPGCNEK